MTEGEADSTIRLYADDTSALVIADDLEEARATAERISNRIITLLQSRGIRLQTPKSKVVVINLQGEPKTQSIIINTCQGPIPESPSLTLLGIDLNSTLTFEARFQTLLAQMHETSANALNLVSILDRMKATLWLKSKNVGLFNYGAEFLPLFSDEQYKALDKAAAKPMIDIFGLHHVKKDNMTYRILHILGRMCSFKDWHIRMILIFASQIVRLNNPPEVAQFIKEGLYYADGSSYQPGMAIHMKYFKKLPLLIRDSLRQDLFPANVGTCLQLIPGPIRDLFGSFSFESKIKAFTDNKCPHGATVKEENCDGCIRHHSICRTIVNNARSFRSNYHLETLATMANRLLNKNFENIDAVTTELSSTLIDFEDFLENLELDSDLN